MDKLRMHSPDLTQDNIGKIRQIFPDCVTEAAGDDGEPRLAIDFDQLKQVLSDHIVEGPQERYRLDWPGKREALLTANAPIARTLRPARDESVSFDTTQNLFIEGDNLDALKLLQESYLGKVKLIYIDPPYNTGNDFIYNDDFAESSYDFLKRSNQHGQDGTRLVANTETNGRFHSDLLSMMYGRLKLSRNLLRDDGAIFMSIDDNEVHNARKIADEIFGEVNFKADISWQKRYTRSNNTVDFTTVVEHILVYAKSDEFSVNLLPRTSEADARYSNPDNDPRGVWKGASFLNPASPSERPNLCYPIQNPNTGELSLPTTNAWRRSKEEFEKLSNENKLYWGKDGKQPVPSIKMFLSEARGLTPINFWDHEYAGNTDEGTRDLAELMMVKAFNNPKPVKLIKRILEHASDEAAIVLDFFVGSGTTAQAVLEQNALDGGNRRYIAVQLPDATDNGPGLGASGFETIADIAKERIRRAGKRAVEGECHEAWNRDIGFRVLKIDSSNMTDVFYRPDEVKQDELFAQVHSVRPDRSAEDLLFQVLIDWGVELSLPITRETLHGKTVFFVDGGALIACFDSDVDDELVKTIAARSPLRAVFRDTSFARDADRINAEQLFQQLSPSTDVKAI